MTCAFIFLIALILVSYSIQKIIYISHKKHLFDEPLENRKIHLVKTPNLGGVAIFATMIFTSSLFLPYTNFNHLNYIIASAVILFFLGLTDDLVGVNPFKKFLAQLVAALIVTLLAGFRFTSLHGIFGLNEIPYTISIIISVLFILLIINSFNLIDGINCLAGSIGLLSCIMFAYFFWKLNEMGFVFLSVAMCGCLTGFLFYNRTPAKIFMGDTGALFLGFLVAVFAINFIELNKVDSIKQAGTIFSSAPAIIFALLIVPIFDTLRVFLLRIIRKKSPFSADRNHIHHRLIDLKLSHQQSTKILLLVNMISLAIVFLFSNLGTELLLFILSAFILILNSILWIVYHKKTNKTARIKGYHKQPQAGNAFDFLLKPSIVLDKKEIGEAVE